MIFSPGGVMGLLGVVLPALALAFVVHRWIEGLDWKTVATALGIGILLVMIFSPFKKRSHSSRGNLVRSTG